MKKFNRIVSLLMVLALAVSAAAVSESAIDNSEMDDNDPWVAAALAADDCEIRYTEDGSARIITATLADDELPMQNARASTNPYMRLKENTH